MTPIHFRVRLCSEERSFCSNNRLKFKIPHRYFKRAQFMLIACWTAKQEAVNNVVRNARWQLGRSDENIRLFSTCPVKEEFFKILQLNFCKKC